jgi:hypothetical protein
MQPEDARPPITSKMLPQPAGQPTINTMRSNSNDPITLEFPV